MNVEVLEDFWIRNYPVIHPVAYVNGTKIGNSITPTNSAPFQTLLSANTNRLRFSKLDVGLGVDRPNIIKSSCIYTNSLSDAEAISLTRL